MKTAERFRRVFAIISLVVLVAVLVAGPTGISTVLADGGGTGHPINPDSTVMKCVQPGEDIGSWTDVGLYLSALSAMLL